MQSCQRRGVELTLELEARAILPVYFISVEVNRPFERSGLRIQYSLFRVSVVLRRDKRGMCACGTQGNQVVVWHQYLSTEAQPCWGSLSLSTRVTIKIHSFLGLNQCYCASESGLSRIRCLSLCQAPWSANSVMACASAALTVRLCPGGTRAGGLQPPVLASHSPKASSNAIRGYNLPLPTCCLLKSLEWEVKLLVTRSHSDVRIIFMSDPTSFESALFSGRERSLRSPASLSSVRCDAGAGSLRMKPVGRL